jgi:pyridoxal/pyridoxine/pyridoxamine kinase
MLQLSFRKVATYNNSNQTASLSKTDTTCEVEQYRIEFPKFPLAFVGSGDLFTALLTAWLTRSGGSNWPCDMDISLALEKTVATMQAVLNRTLLHYKQNEVSNPHKMQVSAMKELRLIQSRDDILNPKIVYRAEKVQVEL